MDLCEPCSINKVLVIKQRLTVYCSGSEVTLIFFYLFQHLLKLFSFTCFYLKSVFVTLFILIFQSEHFFTDHFRIKAGEAQIEMYLLALHFHITYKKEFAGIKQCLSQLW